MSQRKKRRIAWTECKTCGFMMFDPEEGVCRWRSCHGGELVRNCPHCTAPALIHGVTCGASECQEAEYAANERRARARRGGARKAR